MKLQFLVYLFSFTCLYLNAQQYNIKTYRVAEGLPIDAIKAVSQDEYGFLWIGTDDGLVKYDGIGFSTYESALQSKYVKGFLKTKSNKFLVFGDLDLVEIQNKIDTVIFKPLIRGSHAPTDSTISYPKAIYEDKEENIWLAESESVVKYKSGKFKRYVFGRKYNSNEFIRSFQFFEDHQGNLYVVCYGGNVFYYDKEKDEMVLLTSVLCKAINHILYQNKTLWIASNNGLYEALVLPKSEIITKKIEANYQTVSHLAVLPEGHLCISSFIYGMNIVNYSTQVSTKINHSFNSINSTFVSKEGDLWVASDKGLVLMQKKIFALPEENSKTKYVESIHQAYNSPDIYFCEKMNLIKYEEVAPNTFKRKNVFFRYNGYFQTIRSNKRGIWVSNSNHLMLFKNDKLVKEWNLASYGYYVFDILCDKNQNVWLAQSQNTSILKIDTLDNIKKYKLPIQPNSDVRLIVKSDKGIYVAAHGNIKDYLLFKPNEEENFKNISVPLNIKINGEFQIQNLVVIKEVVWMATSHGLFKYQNSTIERINLGERFTDFMVSSITQLDKNNILFSNSYGLFRFDIKSNEYWVYDENLGLPSNTITDHGIFIDQQKRIWIGSSNGVGYTQSKLLLETNRTPKPHCISAIVNGKNVMYNKGLYAPFGSYIRLVYSAITFPENKVSIQYKFNVPNAVWKDLKHHELQLSDLKYGQHQLLTRAKKNTGLSWSEPNLLIIHIGKPLYFSLKFIGSIFLLLCVVVWLSYLVIARILNKRKEYLQNLIRIRTQDLEFANEELSHRNIELDRFVYSASHDLAAPLKSLLGLISITKMENTSEPIAKYLRLMESSINKLDEFIKEVISYSRNSRMKLKYEAFDFTKLINELLEDHHYALNFQAIDFNITDNTGKPMVSDITRLKIILNNLLSNAIKFHRISKDVSPFVKIDLSIVGNTYQIVVEDNGRGISQEHIDAIFEMFYRATIDVQGSGLGLYILKETVVKLGGKVDVKSELNVGTTFTIHIKIPEIETEEAKA